MKFVAALIACISIAVAASAQVPSAPYEWRNVVVGGGGFAPNIVFSTAEQGLAYLRTDMGGAYRWDDKEQQWVPLEDAIPTGSYFGVESLAADPKDPNRVYLAAGMYQRDPAAMLRSSDRGNSWSITPVPFKMGGNEDGRGMGERLAIDPNHTSTLLFGSRHDGLWRSDDSALNWHKVASFPWPGLGPAHGRSTHGGISFVIFDPHSRTVFAGVADPAAQHLYRSTNGGATWQAVTGGPPAALLPVKAAIDPSGDLYVDYCNGLGPNGITIGAVWKLDTRGGRWSDITPERGTEGGYMGLSLDRTHAGRIAVSTVDRWHPGDTVWLSNNGGLSWTSLRERSTTDVSATPFLKFGKPGADFGHWMSGLAFDPFDTSTLAYTTGATVYRTHDALQRKLLWQPWVRGIEQTAIITLASPTGGAPLISGFGDIHGFVHDRLDVSPTAMLLNPDVPNTNNIDYGGLAPSVVVRSASNYRDSPSGTSLGWSEDGGHSWHALQAPPVKLHGELVERFDTNGEAPIAVSADGRTFAVSGPVLLATADRGKSWWMPTGLPENARAIADKADANIWYAVDFARGKLFVSRDGAHSFQPAAAKGLPQDLTSTYPKWREAPSPLLATPGTSGELWFLIAGRLYRSADGGNSFAAASRPDIQIHFFGLGKPAPKANAPALYAVGQKGNLTAVWRSIDGGANWTKINDDRHQWGSRFRMIGGDPRVFGRVYLATDGRGIIYGNPSR